MNSTKSPGPKVYTFVIDLSPGLNLTFTFSEHRAHDEPRSSPTAGGGSVATMPDDRAVTPPPPNQGGKGKGLFTGTLLDGAEPRKLGRNVTREDFETRPEATAPLGLLA